MIVNLAADNSETRGLITPASSIGEITINIPESAATAAREGGQVKPLDAKKLKKELKIAKEMGKKEAKLRKKADKVARADIAKQMRAVEKEREKTRREQARAKYKVEQADRKVALAKAEEDEEEYEAVDSPILNKPLKPPPKTNDGVPDKAAGLLGMWYGEYTRSHKLFTSF